MGCRPGTNGYNERFTRSRTVPKGPANRSDGPLYNRTLIGRWPRGLWPPSRKRVVGVVAHTRVRILLSHQMPCRGLHRTKRWGTVRSLVTNKEKAQADRGSVDRRGSPLAVSASTFTPLAQRLEHVSYKDGVRGSNPLGCTGPLHLEREG